MPLCGFILGILFFAEHIFSAPRVYEDSDTISGSGVQVNYSPINLLQNQSSSGNNFIEGNRVLLTGYLNKEEYSIQAGIGHSNYNAEAVDPINNIRFKLSGKTNFLNISGHYKLSCLDLMCDIEAVQTRPRTIINSNLNAGVSFPEILIKELSIGYIEHSLPYNFDAFYSTANLHMDDFIHRYGFTSEINVGTDLFFLDYQYSRTFLSPKTTGEVVTSIPNGKLTVNIASINYKSKQFSFVIDNLSCRHNSRTYFYNRDLQFSYLFIPEVYFEKYGISAKYIESQNSTYESSVNYARIKFRMIGELDSWPFVSVLESIFVNRLYFRAIGTALANWITFSYNYKNSNWYVNSSLSYIDIRPEFQIDTWEAFFILGGMNRSTLDIRQAGLAFLSIKAEYSLSDITLGVAANQFVPLFVNKFTAAGTGGGGQGVPASGEKKRADGGRWFEFFLKKAI